MAGEEEGAQVSQLALIDNDPREAPESKDLDELWTPRWFFEPLHKEFNFTLDACALSAEAAKVSNFFCPCDDGIAQPWIGQRVWLNPPYSALAAWLHKIHHEVVVARRCPLVVALLPATRSEQPAWQSLIEPWRDGRSPWPDLTLETRFVAKRIAFEGPAADGGTGKFPSVLVIWRRHE